MEKVKVTIIEEMNNLKPFYDEYLRLKTILDLIDDKNVDEKDDENKPVKNVEKKNKKTEKKNKKDTESYKIKITGYMPQYIRVKYNINTNDIFEDRRSLINKTGISPAAIYQWKSKKWVEYIK